MGDSGETSSGGRGESVVYDHGVRRSHCGYCRSKGDTSISHGLWAFNLTVEDYQELLDRGWRRSGCFLYKPEMEKTCCPSYTIRLKANKFAPSKEQSRVLKRMRRFLDGTKDLKVVDRTEGHMNSVKSVSRQSCNLLSGKDVSQSQAKGKKEMLEEDMHISYLSDKINDAAKACIESGEFPSSIQPPKADVKKVKHQVKKKLIEMPEDLLYTSSVCFQIAALLRKSKGELASTASQSRNDLNLSPNIIAEKLASSMDRQGGLSNLFVKACNGHLNFYSSIRHLDSVEEPAAGRTSKNSSKGILSNFEHDQKLDKCPVTPNKKHKLEIRMKQSMFDPEEYALYRRYQIKVHNDKPEKVTESSYKRFLVDTPLKFYSHQCNSQEVPPCGFGSFHQQYLIDDKLVAVGVVDVLPRCLSSKYLFWDPDFAALSLGKFSALKEIEWVRETGNHCPSLQYYYLGYYIHSCNKMRYKAAYNPSELLCPLRYLWVPFNVARPLLDRSSYAVLSDFATLVNGESSSHQLPVNSPPKPCDSDEESDIDDEGEEMDLDYEFESSLNDEPYSDTNSMSLIGGVQPVDVDEIVLDLNGARVQFKDLRKIVGPIRKENIRMLELQLRRFAKVVGESLVRRIVYSIG